VFIGIHTSRAKSPEDAEAVCALWAHAYIPKLTVGFIRGDCATKVDDPCQVVGVDYWSNRAAYAAFLAHEETQRLITEAETHMAARPEHAVYEVRP
jgi:quinol monooxygenase YgiN